MPNETQQPFQDGKQRSQRDEELVAGVLGATEAAEMRELVGGQAEPSETESAPLVAELDLSEGEQTATTEAEKNMAERRKDEYVEWFKEFDKDEKWIDETFIFEDDGRVRVEGSLDLMETGITELPPGLYEVTGTLFLCYNSISEIPDTLDLVGQLDLTSNQITKIKNIPDSVTKLRFHGNQITKIENVPDSVTLLDLSGNNIKVIANIPNSIVELNLGRNPIESLEPLVGRRFKYLLIKNIKATTIPEGIEVEKIYIDPSQKDLVADCIAKGYNVAA